MENKTKQTTVLISCLLLLLIAIIGATYAYFSASASVTEQNLYMHTATPTGLIYDGGGLLSLDNAIPGDRTPVKMFTVENPSTSSVNQIYTLLMHVDQNNFSSTVSKKQLMAYIGYGNCNVNENNDGPLVCDKVIELDLTDGSNKMITGKGVNLYQALIEPNETQIYYIFIKFVDTDTNQDENRNRSFAAHVELTDTILIKDEELPYNDMDKNNKVTQLYIEQSFKTLETLGLRKNSATVDLARRTTTNETANGLFATDDDYGTSYYFRGSRILNNYVKFGKDKDGSDMYWRIIRINGDGSLRIMYDGTQAWNNGVADNNRVAKLNVGFNGSYYDAKFGGFMFGGLNQTNSSRYHQADMTAPDYANSNNAVYNETDSNIKKELDIWYEENILNTGYSSYVSDEIFCNDRTLISGNGYGYSSNTTEFGFSSRVNWNITVLTPTLICPQKNDAFTVGDSNTVGQDDSTGYGNGYLKYPIGLINGDEIIFVGGKSTDTSHFLYKGTDYWSMTPNDYVSSNSYMIMMSTYGYTKGFAGASSLSMVPVINLSQETAQSLIGNGTIGNEYRLS